MQLTMRIIQLVTNVINDTCHDSLSKRLLIINNIHNNNMSKRLPIVDNIYKDNPSEELLDINNTQLLLVV